MPEWSIGAVSKTVVPLREPRVRIPVLPQKTKMKPAAGQWVSFVLHLPAPPAEEHWGGSDSGAIRLASDTRFLHRPQKKLPEQSFLMFVSIEDQRLSRRPVSESIM